MCDKSRIEESKWRRREVRKTTGIPFPRKLPTLTASTGSEKTGAEKTRLRTNALRIAAKVKRVLNEERVAWRE